jgi:hypothetical protein
MAVFYILPKLAKKCSFWQDIFFLTRLKKAAFQGRPAVCGCLF